MATVTHTFLPTTGVPPATGAAALNFVSGTNFPVSALAFDAAVEEFVYFFFRATSYGSGNLTLLLDWYADTASSGNVVWAAQLAAITPDTDSGDIETKAFGTAQTVTDSHLGTTNQRLHRASLTISNLDSIAANDWCCLRVYRDADDAQDTMTGDCLLSLATLTYSDA